MIISISAVDDPVAINRLYAWLRGDAAVVRSAKVALRSLGTSGQMGALEVIDVVLTHATGLLSLAIAYASWRDSRPHAASMTFTADQIVIVDSAASPVAVDDFVAALRPPDQEVRQE